MVFSNCVIVCSQLTAGFKDFEQIRVGGDGDSVVKFKLNSFTCSCVVCFFFFNLLIRLLYLLINQKVCFEVRLYNKTEMSLKKKSIHANDSLDSGLPSD